MKIVAWNIRHGGAKHCDLATVLMAHDPDVIVLGEHQNQKTTSLIDHLRLFGWPYVLTSANPGQENGVAIVSRLPLDARPSPFGPDPFARWGVEARIGNVHVIGVYAPLPDSLGSPRYQREFWQALHGAAEARGHEATVIIGDYNTCATTEDGPNALPCSDAFEHLTILGWTDAWRACNLGANDFSYVHRATNGRSNWRIDHAFVSPVLAGAVKACRYSHAEREAGLSDHAMLLLELE